MARSRPSSKTHSKITQQPLRPTPGARGAYANRTPPRQAADPPRDPTGEYHVKCRELADELGMDIGDVMDDWDHAAAIRQYDGNTIRDEANRLGFEDIAVMLRRQKGAA